MALGFLWNYLGSAGFTGSPVFLGSSLQHKLYFHGFVHSAVCSCMQANQPWYTSPALTGFLDPWCLTSMPLHSYSVYTCKTSTVCLTQSSPAILRGNLAPLDHSATTCGTSPLNPGKHFLIRLFFCGVPWRPCFLRHSPVKWICMKIPRNSCWLGACLLCHPCAASKVSH